MDASEVVHAVDLFLKDMDELDRQQPPARRTKGTDKRPRVAKAQVSEPPKKKKVHSWLRTKQELGLLRQQSQEMREQLSSLQRQQERRRRKLGISRKQLDQLHKSKIGANKELQLLQEAQKENAGLKQSLRSYLQRSSTFQRVIETAKVEESVANAAVPVSAVRDVLEMGTFAQLKISSASTFNALEERVNKRFEGFQAILDEIQQAAVTLDTEQVRLYNAEGEAVAVMEYQCSRLLPFGESATSNAAWSIVEEGGATLKQATNVVRRSKDVHAVDSRFAVPLGHDQVVTVDIHCVAKRFVVPGGCVVLAEASSEWSARRGPLVLWSQGSRESVWFVAREVALNPEKTSCCQVKAVARSEAVKDRVVKQDTPTTQSAFSHELAVSSFRELVDLQRQHLENMLWDSARTTGK